MSGTVQKFYKTRKANVDSSLSTNLQEKPCCAKFLLKGNKPVPSIFEEHEILLPKAQY
jgi:hypothetical protein